MILTAGLSPAWQQILQFDSFAPGEVNRAATATWCASGKVVNVGIALHQLGGPHRMLSLSGGAFGRQLRDDLAALGVDCRWIETVAPTRVCTTILNAADGSTTELVENARPVADDELRRFREAFAEEAPRAKMLVLTGSLPGNVDAGLFRELMKQTSAPVVLDIAGKPLLEALPLRPLVVKPNREELARTLATSVDGDEQLRSAMEEVHERGAQWVVVTNGKKPVAIRSPEGFFRAQPPLVKVANPIGCGDSLAAGLAWGIHDGRDPLDAIRLGMACAAENARQLLPARFSWSAINDLLRSIHVEQW